MITNKNFPREIMPQIRKADLKNAPHPYKKMNMLVRIRTSAWYARKSKRRVQTNNYQTYYSR